MIIDLLQVFVHEPWLRELDFSTLELLSSRNVSRDLRSREDDVVWRVKQQQNRIYVYLLIEFQSTIDRACDKDSPRLQPILAHMF